MKSESAEVEYLVRARWSRVRQSWCSGSISFLKVMCGSALETTFFARSSSPPARRTPIARPFSTRIFSTEVLRRSWPPAFFSARR